MIRKYLSILSIVAVYGFCTGLILPVSGVAQSNSSLPPIYLLLLEDEQRRVSGTTMPITPTDPMSPEERIAAIHTTQTILNDLVAQGLLPEVNTPLDQRNQEEEVRTMAQALVDLPEVLAVVIDETGLGATIVLADGFSMALVNDRAPLSDHVAKMDLSELAGRFSKQSAARTAALPGSNQAVFVAIDGGQEVADELAPMLTANGYQLATTSGSISAMRNLYKDLGFLYLDTHGVSYQHVTPIVDSATGKVTSVVWGDYFYGVQSDTKVFQDDLINYKDELATGEIIVMFVPSQIENKVDLKLAVTQSFIERNWSFDGGGVILHTCFGGAGEFSLLPFFRGRECYGACPSLEALGRTVLDPRPLRQAILNAGAEILISFDNYSWATSAKPSTSFFIDRMIGANESAYQADPPLRPFDWNNIREEMDSLGLMSFWHGNRLVNVTFETNGNSFLLAPTIKNMDIVDDIEKGPGKLTINGIFGDDSGTVKLDGIPLSIETWANDKIEALVPYNASPTNGEVIAATPQNIDSNGVPLTEWEGTVTLSRTGNGLESKAKIDVVFRADVHEFRNSSSEDPQERLIKTYISPRTKGTVSGSGAYTNNDTTVEYITSSNPASEDMTLLGKFAVDNLSNPPSKTAISGVPAGRMDDGISEFAGVVTLDPAANRAEICMWILGFHDIRMDGTLMDFKGTILLGPEVSDSAQGLLRCVTMTLNDDHTISSGQRVDTSGDATTTLHWTKFIPLSPPDSNTKG